MENKGWIKTYRKIQDCWIWLDKEPFDKRSAWIDLLLTANHSDKKILFNGELITVKRGQILTSIRKLSDKWKWSYDKCVRFLKLLVSDGMLIKESNKSRTLLTIVNYEVYQDLPNANECTDNGSSNRTYRTPAIEPTEHLQVTNKNDKELKNDKECIKNEREYNARSPSDDLQPQNFNVEKAWQDTFEIYPKKSYAVMAKQVWTKKILEVIEPNQKEVAKLIYLATKMYLDDYTKRNPSDSEEYKYIPKYSDWLMNDCDYWIFEYEKKNRKE